MVRAALLWTVDYRRWTFFGTETQREEVYRRPLTDDR